MTIYKDNFGFTIKWLHFPFYLGYSVNYKNDYIYVDPFKKFKKSFLYIFQCRPLSNISHDPPFYIHIIITIILNLVFYCKHRLRC
jgi:hypothetical protein